MDKRPKTIHIFLPNGDSQGIRISGITSMNVQGILIPRSYLGKAEEREETKNVSLYFLFGEDSHGEKETVYIGKTENGLKRLREHNITKKFWKYAVLFVSSDRQNSLNVADVGYLEKLAIKEAKRTNRYHVDNEKSGNITTVAEWRESDLVGIFEVIEVLLSTLGFPVFESLTKNIDSELLYCEARGVKATGQLTDEGFVVFKNSELALQPVDSIANNTSHINRIEDLENEKIIQKLEDKYIFLENHLFNSPSDASRTITRRQSNGMEEWKNIAGETLNEIKRSND